ncbi:MAG: type IIL restriction-modification enzyme MmeI, partial [Cyclobacteriaceae bacterium]
TYILIPSTTSENRRYIPLGFFKKDDIANNSCHTIPDGNLYHFGVLTSAMHMAWVRAVCGRLKSDFRYSKDIVYNNYPWPLNPENKQVKSIELDNALDLAYRPQAFTREANIMLFLFELYEKYTADLFTKEKVKKSRKNGKQV